MVIINQQQQQQQNNRKQCQISVNQDRLGSAIQKDNPRLSIDNNAEDQHQHIAIVVSESKLDVSGIDLTFKFSSTFLQPQRKNERLSLQLSACITIYRIFQKGLISYKINQVFQKGLISYNLQHSFWTIFYFIFTAFSNILSIWRKKDF